MATIYADYNATTPLDPRVFEAMKPWFLVEPGNAGSRTHNYGNRAKDAVEAARARVARVLGVLPEEIIFTSGATEASNLAVLGLAQYGEETGCCHIVSTSIEHKAVLEPLEYLSRRGFEVELVPVTSGGYVEPDEIKRRLRPDTLLVSVMHANNETGVLQPVQEVSELLADSDSFFHIDAAQTFGKEVETLRGIHCDFLSVSAHKVYGPKGIGALYVRRRVNERHAIQPLLHGGGQERGLRPGTMPVPLAVGLGESGEFAEHEYLDRCQAANRVKQQFLSELSAVEHYINGDSTRAQAHVANITFPGVDSEALMIAIREDLAISNGSACTSANYSPSHVLVAMGLDGEEIASSVRISWGVGIQTLPAEPIINAVQKLKFVG